MIRTAIRFGGSAGAIVIGFMIVCFAYTDNRGMLTSEAVGYLVMVAALSLTFVGIKRYRDGELGGVIRFRQGAALALLMSVAAGVVYVTLWEVYLATGGADFIDQYSAAYLAAERAKGVSPAELEALTRELEALRAGYQDPLFRLPVTFLEIFPLALLVSLASAALLANPRVWRRRD